MCPPPVPQHLKPPCGVHLVHLFKDSSFFFFFSDKRFFPHKVTIVFRCSQLQLSLTKAGVTAKSVSEVREISLSWGGGKKKPHFNSPDPRANLNAHLRIFLNRPFLSTFQVTSVCTFTEDIKQPAGILQPEGIHLGAFFSIPTAMTHVPIVTLAI